MNYDDRHSQALDAARTIDETGKVAGKKKSTAKPATARTKAPPATTRARMIEGAAQLLARRGLQATSFSDVLEFTSAPRGSVYHHFPGGKDELVREALDLASGQMAQILARKPDASALEISELFLRIWRSILLGSQFEAGCAVLAVTVAAESPELLEHAAAIFRSWRVKLAELLQRGGLAPQEAARFAATLLAASEGAVVLSRGERSIEPFELVAAQLLDQVRRLQKV